MDSEVQDGRNLQSDTGRPWWLWSWTWRVLLETMGHNNTFIDR